MISSALIGTGALILYIMHRISKMDTSNPTFKKEARRVAFENAAVNADCDLEGGGHSSGLCVVVDELTRKYKTIPQTKAYGLLPH